MSKKLISVSVFALALAAASPALAESLDVSSVTLSVPVSYADLNVSTTSGAKVLKTRIEKAAALVCGPAPYILDLKSNVIYQSCIDETVASAISSSGLPALAALYGEPAATLAQN